MTPEAIQSTIRSAMQAQGVSMGGLDRAAGLGSGTTSHYLRAVSQYTHLYNLLSMLRALGLRIRIAGHPIEWISDLTVALQAAKQAQGICYEQLASRMGIAAKSASHYMIPCRQGRINVGTLCRLADALGVSITIEQVAP